MLMLGPNVSIIKVGVIYAWWNGKENWLLAIKKKINLRQWNRSHPTLITLVGYPCYCVWASKDIIVIDTKCSNSDASLLYPTHHPVGNGITIIIQKLC